MHTRPVDDFSPPTGEALHRIEHRRRRSVRLQISADELERMVATFVASHGGITVCPPIYAAPSPHYRVAPAVKADGAP